MINLPVLAFVDWAGMDKLDMDGDESAARPDFACPYYFQWL